MSTSEVGAIVGSSRPAGLTSQPGVSHRFQSSLEVGFQERKAMSSKRVAAILGLICLLLAPVVIQAHHSFAAEFDSTKPVKMTGSVGKVEWTNPHAFIFIKVTELCDGPPPPAA